MHEDTLAPKLRDFACQLIAHEKKAEGIRGEALAAFRVCDRLRRPLSKLMGLAAFVALLSRALILAKAEAPCLSGVEVADDASLTGADEIKVEARRKLPRPRSFLSPI